MHQPATTPYPSVFYAYEVFPARRPTNPAPQVAVVGAGPVGLLTALDLARFGVACIVLGEERQVSHGSRAVVLTRRSLEILQQVGVERRFLEKGLPWHQGRSYFRGHEVYRMVMPHDPNDRFLPALNIQQQYIEEFLVEACEANPLIELCFGQKVVGISQDQERVTLRVDAEAGEYDLHPQWVVAADGGRSTLRRLMNLRLEGRSYTGRFVITDIRAPLDLPTERRCYFDPPWNPGSNVLVHRLPDGIWRIDLKLPDGESPEEALDPARLAGRIGAVLEMVGQPVAWELDWAAVYSANTLTLPDFVIGRVAFAGDAAHLLPIFGVRGMNTGFQDANNLAWKLAFVARGWAGPELLASYSAERVAAAREICEEGGRSTRFMTPQSDGSRLMRDAVLSYSLSEDFANDLMHWRTSRPHDYGESALNTHSASEREFDGGIACGQPLRNVDLGGGTFLLDLLRARPGIHVLAFDGDGSHHGEMSELLSHLQRGDLPIVRIRVTRGAAVATDAADVVVPDPDGRIHALYAAGAGTVYLVRPDFHVCARWKRTTSRDLAHALQRLAGKADAPTPALAPAPSICADGQPADGKLPKQMPIRDLEVVYDDLADALDGCHPDQRGRYLAKLALALANLTGDQRAVHQAIAAARRDLD